MNLIAKTYRHLLWQGRLSREVLARAGSHTVLGTGALVIAKYAELFALFLPLKVLILLSGDRVPHYLEPFISPTTKMQWVIAFSVAIFFLYMSSIALVTWSNRQYTQAGNLLQSARNLSRGSRRRLHNCYFRLWHANSEAFVAIVGFVIIGLLSPLLLAALLVFLIAELVMASYLVERTSGVSGRIGRKLRDEYAAVLQYGTALNFLLVFTVLILDFYVSEELHLISAVLIIFLTRRCLQSLSRFARGAILLATRDYDAEALLLGVGMFRLDVDLRNEVPVEP